MTKDISADVVIIGSGISALIVADRLSKHKNVIIITKSAKEQSNSFRAQGGVAAALSEKDHWVCHYKDTLLAGNDHNEEKAVQLLVQKGPQLLKRMMEDGMEFDRDVNGALLYGQEGAHSMRRIVHAGGDATGKALVQFLFDRLKGNANVTILENTLAVDLVVTNNQCIGVIVQTTTGKREQLIANDTILAAGGCGALYSHTSNAPTITGDGIALAYRAGAQLIDLEFVQFHPTLLYRDGKAQGLISEAVRGEGAILVTEQGAHLMADKHPQKDLAPRDVVSREMYRALTNGEQIFLDISRIKHFSCRFPTITTLCQQHGIDLTKGKIPIVPGAHFHMGGVKVNLRGQTSIPHLYAIGEVACSGVHGANRLASNSLLEGIVFANELADYLLHQRGGRDERPTIIQQQDYKKIPALKLPKKQEIREIMMKHVGIIREEQGLLYAKQWLEQYVPNGGKARRLDQYTQEQIEIFNMLQTAWLITTSALLRKESRGGHYRSDFPMERQEWKRKRIIHNDSVSVHYAL